MKKVIVTGGAGYIGSHSAVELAKAGFEPILIDNFSNSERDVLGGIAEIIGREVTLYEADCRDKAALDRIFSLEGPVLGVLHFAAFKAVGESVQKPTMYYSNNLGGMATLLEVMLEHGVRELVFSSSCTVYGSPDENPVTESAPIQDATSPYAYTKQASERMVEDALQGNQGIRAVTLRYFNPIGAHPTGLIGELPLGPPNNLIPYLTQTVAGIREQLTVFGGDYDTPDGSCIRDYIHVVDLAKAHVKAIEYIENRPSKERFNLIANIGTGQGSSVLEVINAFEKVNGLKVNYRVGDRRPGDVEQVWAATGGRAAQLGWVPELSLEDALRDAWNWQVMLGKREES